MKTKNNVYIKPYLSAKQGYKDIWIDDCNRDNQVDYRATSYLHYVNSNGREYCVPLKNDKNDTYFLVGYNRVYLSHPFYLLIIYEGDKDRVINLLNGIKLKALYKETIEECDKVLKELENIIVTNKNGKIYYNFVGVVA